MKNQTIPLGVSCRLYFDLVDRLRKNNDPCTPEAAAALAIKAWLAEHYGNPGRRGYQWKELFLPDGTDLRMRYLRTWYFARIEGDELSYAGEAMSPLEWTCAVTGTVRNPWRDIWIRRSFHDSWLRADQWREQNRAAPLTSGAERRVRARRRTD